MTLRADKIDFLLDSVTGDLDISAGHLQLSSDITGAAQGAMIRVKQIKGEWFLNKLQGVAYIATPGIVTQQEALLGSKFERSKFERALRLVLEQSPNVVRVLLLTVTEFKRERRVSSRWQLRTAFGDTAVIETVH